MKIFLLILQLFTYVIALKLKSNVSFMLIGVYKESFEVAVYKLSIKDNTSFLRFIDENFEIYLLDFFSIETDDHVHRNLTFRKKNDPHTQEYSAKNLITDKRMTTVYKFNFGSFLYTFTYFCRSDSNCRGEVQLLNFWFTNGWRSKTEKKKITKYLQIDANLTLCSRLSFDDQETCVDGLKTDDDENQFIMLVALIMIMLALSIIMVQIYECHQKYVEKKVLSIFRKAKPNAWH